MKKQLLFGVFLVLVCTVSEAQITKQAYLARLEKELNDLKGVRRIPILTELYLIRKHDEAVLNEVRQIAETKQEMHALLHWKMLSAKHLLDQRKYDSARTIILPELDIRSQYKVDEREALLRLAGSMYARMGLRDSAMLYLQEALALKDEVQPSAYIKTGVILTELHLRSGELEQGRRVLEDLSPVINQQLFSDSIFTTIFDKGRLHYFHGIIHFYQGEYQPSQQQLLAALHHFETVMDSTYLGGVLNMMAACYSNLKHYEPAYETFKKSIVVHENIRDSVSVVVIIENMANCYSDEGNFDQAFHYYNLALERNKKIGDINRDAHIYNNLGIAHYRNGDYQQAAILYRKAFDLRGGFQNKFKRDLASGLINLGSTYMQTGDYRLAEEYLTKGLEIAKETNMKQQQKTVTELIAQLYEKTGDFKLANIFLKENGQIKDSLYQIEIQESITEMQAKYDTQKKQAEIERQSAEIALLAKDQKLAQSRTTALAGSVVLLLIIGLLTYKRSQIQKALVKSELALSQEREEKLRLDLEYKNQELINFAMHITQKDYFIRSLNAQLETISKNGGDPEELRIMKEIVKSNETLTKDREDFDHYVQNVCEGFFAKLSQTYPDISANDKKLAALIRLDLSSKEISTILNISPKSVDQSRYRLRKKMNLDNNANLPEILKSV